ncbi:hypothetical protein HZC31_02430 [Candidatus Woesearchaeota archaeon]|nr:hypothetical protein [Candidatus Woesearchaeota archaeon]
MAETRTYEIETSLVLEDFRQLSWGIERIVLDSISNHLPADSNGTTTSVKLEQDGVYVDWREADRTKKTTELVFEDNGSGYDAGLLSVLFSPKAGDPFSVGQFGEGLKRVASAALKEGLEVEYRSKNWRAKPFRKSEHIGGHNINRLCFRVTENGDRLEGSRTVFTNPSVQLLDEVFQIDKKVLALNKDYTVLYDEKEREDDPFGFAVYTLENNKNSPLTSIPIAASCEVLPTRNTASLLDYEIGSQQAVGHLTQFRNKAHYGSSPKRKYNSRIIQMQDDTTSLFVKGVRVEEIEGIFSYDLGLDDISPDRMFVHRDKALDDLEELLKDCTNTEVIEKILQRTHDDPEKWYYECYAFAKRGPSKNGLYGEINDDISMLRTIKMFKENLSIKNYLKIQKNLWVTTFKKMYGENAVLASDDVNTNQDALLMEYTPVKLNRCIATYLKENGVQTADTIRKEHEYHWIERSDLTEDEQQMLTRVDEINAALLEERIPIDVRVYSGLFTKTGREVESSKGVQITEADGTRYIGIKRERLRAYPIRLTSM